MRLEVWLYGSLARVAPTEGQLGFSRLQLELPVGSTMSDLLTALGLPVAEKGITFVNGELSDMPGLAADLQRELQDGDRVALFDRRSMWPMQYRLGASVSKDLEEAILRRKGSPIQHSWT